MPAPGLAHGPADAGMDVDVVMIGVNVPAEDAPDEREDGRQLEEFEEGLVSVQEAHQVHAPVFRVEHSRSLLLRVYPVLGLDEHLHQPGRDRVTDNEVAVPIESRTLLIGDPNAVVGDNRVLICRGLRRGLTECNGHRTPPFSRDFKASSWTWHS